MNVARENGAKEVTIQALAISNPKLGEELVKEGWKKVTVKVGDQLVEGYEKTFKVK